MNLADMIELNQEEAEHLGYAPEDEISLTKTEDRYIIYKKGHFIDSIMDHQSLFDIA